MDRDDQKRKLKTAELRAFKPMESGGRQMKDIFRG
jgi:hypothetical protein